MNSAALLVTPRSLCAGDRGVARRAYRLRVGCREGAPARSPPTEPRRKENKMAVMAGKQGLIMGVANERSIAWGIAKAAHAQGARPAFTYQGAALGKRVRPLAESLESDFVVEADVGSEASLDSVFAEIAERWGRLDFLVHAIAFSDKNELTGKYIETSRGNFLRTLEISCFSFTDVCRRAVPLMQDGGSLLTLTYYGAERVMPHYNVMGVAKAALEASVRYLAADLGGDNLRVNAISAGPIKTLAAYGIGDFHYILKHHADRAPLRRNVEAREVGNVTLFLCSPLASAITGEVLHVDCGYNIMAF